jgi:hypothetical protein
VIGVRKLGEQGYFDRNTATENLPPVCRAWTMAVLKPKRMSHPMAESKAESHNHALKIRSEPLKSKKSVDPLKGECNN